MQFQLFLVYLWSVQTVFLNSLQTDGLNDSMSLLPLSYSSDSVSSLCVTILYVRCWLILLLGVIYTVLQNASLPNGSLRLVSMGNLQSFVTLVPSSDFITRRSLSFESIHPVTYVISLLLFVSFSSYVLVRASVILSVSAFLPAATLRGHPQNL